MIRAHALILLAIVALVIALLVLRPVQFMAESIKATPAGVVWLYRYEAPRTLFT